MSARNTEARRKFAELAAQYYAAGRQAFVWNLQPVGPNVLHHAVEALLKAATVEVVGLDDLKDRLRHNLKKALARIS